MPTQADAVAAKHYMETGICACGKHESQHVTSLDELKAPGAIRCKLLRGEVEKWMTGAFRQASPAAE
jgi:hypothetical protein